MSEQLIEHPNCPYCRAQVKPGDAQAKQACTTCMTWHHKECWQEHGGCSVCPKPGPALPAAPALATADAARRRTGSGSDDAVLSTCWILLIALGLGGVFVYMTEERRQQERWQGIHRHAENLIHLVARVGGTPEPFGSEGAAPRFDLPPATQHVWSSERKQLADIVHERGGLRGVQGSGEMQRTALLTQLRAAALRPALALLAGDAKAAKAEVDAYRALTVELKDVDLDRTRRLQVDRLVDAIERRLGAGKVSLPVLAEEQVWPWHWQRIRIERAGGPTASVFPDGSIWRAGSRLGQLDLSGSVEGKGEITPDGTIRAGGGEIGSFAKGVVRLHGKPWATIAADGAIQVEAQPWGRAVGERYLFRTQERESARQSRAVVAYLVFFSGARKSR